MSSSSQFGPDKVCTAFPFLSLIDNKAYKNFNLYFKKKTLKTSRYLDYRCNTSYTCVYTQIHVSVLKQALSHQMFIIMATMHVISSSQKEIQHIINKLKLKKINIPFSFYQQRLQFCPKHNVMQTKQRTFPCWSVYGSLRLCCVYNVHSQCRTRLDYYSVSE